MKQIRSTPVSDRFTPSKILHWSTHPYRALKFRFLARVFVVYPPLHISSACNKPKNEKKIRKINAHRYFGRPFNEPKPPFSPKIDLFFCWLRIVWTNPRVTPEEHVVRWSENKRFKDLLTATVDKSAKSCP